jgi:PKD repeat protein
MKRIALLILIFISFLQMLNSQTQENIEFARQTLDTRGEFYFTFRANSTDIVNELNEFIWIDKREGTTFYAYATETAFNQFLAYNLSFEPVYDYYDKTRALTMATSTAQMANWDRYPTHDVYLQMLDDFVANYPDLCRLETIGTSVNGYEIKSLVISDNVDTDEDEPEFWWSGTMHGDETAGYVLLLRFADYLLSNYGTIAQVTDLVDNIEIYINPLANPDGTFNNSSDGTDVSNATRANTNGIDLNRNFPTLNGDSYTLQPEIQCMMDYSAERDFVMSVNTHGGIELLNYPWDTWKSYENLHPDTDWWEYVCFVYADQVEIDAPATYFEGPGGSNTTGVTHGADWYYAFGSRQDYMNYHRNIREVTLEWSDTKLLGVEYLDAYWGYNKQAMLDYTEQVLYGFRGIVTDACTGSALENVKVEIVGHDKDNTEVYSSAPVGNYHRLIYEGTYDVTFSLDGYHSQTHTVSVLNDNSTRLDIQLIPDDIALPDFEADETTVFVGSEVQFSDLCTGDVTSYAWTFEGGNPSESSDAEPSVVYASEGTYDVELEIVSGGCTVSELKQDYIVVSPPAEPVAAFSSDTTQTCSGQIHFYNESEYADEFLWEFGDGQESTEENPVHIYTANGTYSVSLTATNDYGEDVFSITDYITIADLPETPLTSDVEHCGPSEIELSATADGEIRWYDAEMDGSLLETGNTYTAFFDENTTVYLENHIAAPKYFAGKVDNSGEGGYYTYNTQHGLVFDALADFRLESVKVYADGGGERTIQLLDNGDNLIQSASINIPDGESRISLNFDIPEGAGYQLMGPNIPNLYRNGANGSPELDYPYTVNDIISIHGNSADNLSYYYYFYDWEITTGYDCTSPRVPVNVTIFDLPQVDLGNDIALCEGESVVLDAGSGFANYQWSPAGTEQSIELSSEGTYAVTVENDEGCSASDEIEITVNPLPELSFTDVPENANDGDGSITAVVTNGTEPYTYLWENDEITETIDGLHAGNYCLTVTDDNACTISECHNLASTTPYVIADFEADITEACQPLTVQFSDLSTGNIDEWLWDFGDDTNSDLSDPQHIYSAPGLYSVSLTVSNASESDTKTLTDYILVLERPELETSVLHESSAGANDGEASVFIFGDDEPYSIMWSNSETTQTITGLSAGFYSVAVLGNNGCVATAIAEVELITELSHLMSNLSEIFPNPAKDKISIHASKIIRKVTLFDLSGRVQLQFSPNLAEIDLSLEKLTGIYLIRLEYDNAEYSLHKLVVE